MESSEAFDISNVSEPPDAEVIYVGDVIQNGIPLQMKQFSADYPLAELFAFYKQRWSDIGEREENVPAYIEKKAGDWWILSKMEESCSVVVQAKESEPGRVEGFISVSDLSRKKGTGSAVDEFPLLESSQLVSSTEAVDKGRDAATLIIMSESSVEDNSEYYRQEMVTQGWSFQRGDTRNNTTTLYFSRQGQLCEMAISPADEGKTAIFANLVDKQKDD
jgi:hypothetical protein